MEVFLNESSLNSQYLNEYEFVGSIKLFLGALDRLNKHSSQNQSQVYKSAYLFYSCGFSNTMLSTLLKKNHFINELFVQNLNLISPQVWQKEQLHDNNSRYDFNANNYCGFSPAELAERILQNTQLKGFLLNFTKSEFSNVNEIQVIKDKVHEINVECVSYDSDVEEWLIKHNLYNPDDEYDINSGIAPRDSQTVLKDQNIFEKTTYLKNNGRVVFRRKGCNELWVVDRSSKHAGVKAHIEVFDENTRKHLGTSLYNKIDLNRNYIENDRLIILS